MLACLRGLFSFSRSMANVFYNLEVSFHHPAWVWLLQSVWWVRAKSCLTLCDPLDRSPSSSSVHRISQARILEWVAISSFRLSSRSRNRTWVCCISCISRWMLYQLSHLGSPPTPNFWLLPQDRKNVELVSNILPSLGAAQGTGFCLIWLGLPMGMVA